MYQVNIGDKIIYYPGSDIADIFETDLNEEVGIAGEFVFRIAPDNNAYDELDIGKLVTLFEDGEESWRGEIRDIKIDFNKIAEVYVLEDLAWMGDEYMAPAKITNQSYAQRLTAAVNAYNSNRPAERQFRVGYITNVTSSANCNWTTEYEWSILESIRNCICKDDGYVRVRRVTSGGTVTRYIDVVSLEDYGVAAEQPIEYGYNLLEYLKEYDCGNLTNVLTPYGDELEDQEVYENYSQRLQGTTISDATSIATYGRHAKAVIFKGVTSLNQLNGLAQAYITRYKNPQLTLEVTAIDLAEYENIASIKNGDSVRVIAKPFNIDQRLYLVQMHRKIENPDKNTLTLSGQVRRKTLTSHMITTAQAVEDIPSESSILKTAKKNALNMILDQNQGGYVVDEYYYDSEQRPLYKIATNICNAATIEASTKRWRFALNGIGYMHRDNINQSWSTMDVALTMNGEVVADFVTTGTMQADRIRGGLLALGGSNQGAYKNGTIEMYNSSNSLIGRWNYSGIEILQGTIKLTKQSFSDANNGLYLGTDGIALGANNKFSVNNQGYLTSKSGLIGGFTIDETNLHTGTSGSGVWISGKNEHGCPKGEVTVGQHGMGLIRIGYRHGSRTGIIWEANDDEKYFIDLYEIGERI